MANGVTVNGQRLRWEEFFDFVEQSGHDTGNNELEDYRRENAVVTPDGCLHLRLVPVGHGRYHSGKVRSKRSISEMAPGGGRMRVVVQGPLAKDCRALPALPRGLWPAIWLLPNGPGWPMGGEVDLYESMVFEHTQGHVATGFSTLHFGAAVNKDAMYTDRRTGKRHWGLEMGERYAWDTTCFHTLDFQWERVESAWRCSFTVDGKHIWTFTTTRQDAFADFEKDKDFHTDRPAAFAPGALGDPAAVFQRALENVESKGLHLICNLAFGGTPFHVVDHFEGATLVVKCVEVHASEP